MGSWPDGRSVGREGRSSHGTTAPHPEAALPNAPSAHPENTFFFRVRLSPLCSKSLCFCVCVCLSPFRLSPLCLSPLLCFTSLPFTFCSNLSAFHLSTFHPSTFHPSTSHPPPFTPPAFQPSVSAFASASPLRLRITHAMAQPPLGEASLLGIPLEIRHMIFRLASVRDTKPCNVLRRWFEKEEVRESIAALVASDPDGLAPRAAFEDEHDEHSEDEGGGQHAQGEPDETDDGWQHALAEPAENDDEDSPPAPIVRAHGKWRHIPKLLRITQRPPPVELFLLSKQISVEAKDWFYQATTFEIDATASFSHQTFFADALAQMAESAFSPMTNIKRAVVTFAWDTAWIRAETTGFADAVFPSLLEELAACVLSILHQASELEQLVIHWHDSADDDGAKALRADILERFLLNLKADIKMEDHIIASDAKPHAESIAGRLRKEFQSIFDNGCETF